jgi:hypothetical protein
MHPRVTRLAARADAALARRAERSAALMTAAERAAELHTLFAELARRAGKPRRARPTPRWRWNTSQRCGGQSCRPLKSDDGGPAGGRGVAMTPSVRRLRGRADAALHRDLDRRLRTELDRLGFDPAELPAAFWEMLVGRREPAAEERADLLRLAGGDVAPDLPGAELAMAALDGAMATAEAMTDAQLLEYARCRGLA